MGLKTGSARESSAAAADGAEPISASTLIPQPPSREPVLSKTFSSTVGGWSAERIESEIKDPAQRRDVLDRIADLAKVEPQDWQSRRADVDKSFFPGLLKEAIAQRDHVLQELEKFEIPNRDDLLFRIRMALEESLINHVKHGNRHDPAKTISFDAEILSEGKEFKLLSVTTRDQGRGFDRSAVADACAEENLEKLSGRGTLYIDAYADKVTYFDGGRGLALMFRPRA